MRRVVITGLGVVAANGIGVDDFWNACVEGRSGVGPIRSFDASKHPVRIAAEVQDDFNPAQYLPGHAHKGLKIMGRAAKFGIGAAGMAIADSGVELGYHDPERIGVVMGSGLIPMELNEVMPLLLETGQEDGSLDLAHMSPKADSPLAPMWLLKYLPNMLAAHISMAFNTQGPNSTVTTACVAGTEAVGQGFRMIMRDEADMVITGGADSRIDPLLLLAYSSLGALSRASRKAPEVSRPFDLLRDGFVLGEGAGVVILEDYDRARERGARIYAEVLGFGTSFDAYSVIKPDPEGRGAARAMRAALREAQVDRLDIDHINAHGTSTRLNDRMETNAVKAVFGDHAKKIPLSSVKSMLGHSIGAAGAIEAVVLAKTLQEQLVPPTINLTYPDPACDLDYTPREARDIKAKLAVSNSFGFGGQNGTLVMAAI